MSIDTKPLSAAAAVRILRDLAERDYQPTLARIDMTITDSSRFAAAARSVQEAVSADEASGADTADDDIVVDLVRPTAEDLQVIFEEAAATVA